MTPSLPQLLALLRAARAADVVLSNDALDHMIALAERAQFDAVRAERTLDYIVADALEDEQIAARVSARRRFVEAVVGERRRG